jgi:DNA invertase Pin-like site-specific DNA recombinase
LVRQILGAVAQFEKAALVAKLAAARKRTGRMGGKKPLTLTRPDVAARAAALANNGIPLRTIAARLPDEGLTTPSGKPYGPSAIARMLR